MRAKHGCPPLVAVGFNSGGCQLGWHSPANLKQMDRAVPTKIHILWQLMDFLELMQLPRFCLRQGGVEAAFLMELRCSKYCETRLPGHFASRSPLISPVSMILQK